VIQAKFPEEFSVLTPVFADADQSKPPIGYDRQPRAAVSPDGVVQQHLSRFGLLPATKEEPDAWIHYSVHHPSGARQDLHYSRRACAINMQGHVDGERALTWLARGSSVGGNGWGINERWFERYGGPTQQEHNPTLGGGARVPLTGPHWSGRPLHMLLSQTRLEGAVEPLEWDPDGTDPGGGGGADHGGGPMRPVIWDGMRQFWRYEPFLHGSRYVSRMTEWSYHQRGWPMTPEVSPWLGHNVLAPHLVGRTFDECTLFDLESGQPHVVADFKPPSQTQRYLTRWEIGKRLMGHRTEAGTWTWWPSPVPSGYVGVLLRFPARDFCVGFCIRIHDDDDRLQQATRVNLVQNVWTARGGDPMNDQNLGVDLLSKGQSGRVPGWVGLSALVYIGPSAGALDVMQACKAEGLLDLPPARDLPVLDGVLPP
jgi:hypothetical protein